LSFEAEFEFAILHVGVDRALTLRNCLVDNGDIFLLNFAVFGGLDDVAGNLEVLLEVGDPGFTSAGLRVERKVLLVGAGHGEDIAGALLGDVGHLVVGFSSSGGGSSIDERRHVQGALSSRAGWELSGLEVRVNHADGLGDEREDGQLELFSLLLSVEGAFDDLAIVDESLILFRSIGGGYTSHLIVLEEGGHRSAADGPLVSRALFGQVGDRGSNGTTEHLSGMLGG